MGIEKRIHLVILTLIFATACGDFRGVFESSINTSHHPTQSMPQTSTAKPAKGGALTAAQVAKLDESVPEPGTPRETIITRLGAYYFVRRGDTLASISDKFHIGWENVAQINGLYDSDLVVGRRLFIPNKKSLPQYVVVNKVISEDHSPASRNKTVQFIWPIENPRVTNGFGPGRHGSHPGIDIGVKTGTPVFAVEEGRVVYAQRMSTYGNLIVIKHAGDYFTAYAHNSQILVNVGQHVKKGQNISLSGSTGRSTGPHLHFEVHHKTELVDPMSMLPKI